MQSVAIVTDSSTDIPQELAEELGIVIAPLHVIIEGRDYRDKIDISGAEFYRLLPKLNPLPTTSGVGVPDFLQAYEKALKMADSVVCLAIAEPLSTTFNSACVAREMMAEADIAVVDTQTAAAGEALIAIAAGKAAKEGADKAQVLALVEELIPRVDTLITADTLEYLHRGGRLTATQALIAKFLGFRPILRLRQGKIVPVGRARSRRRSIEHLLQLMEEGVGTEGTICAAIMHALASEESKALRDEIAERFNCREIFILDDLGPVAGTHLGPGALGVGFYALP